MDQQGSTPDTQVGGAISHSPQSSADSSTPVQPSQSQSQESATSGDLLGRLQDKIQNGEPAADTPSQTPQDTPTPQLEPQNPVQQPVGDSVDPELARWASSQNLTLSTPESITLAKRLRDTQAALHKAKNDSIQSIQTPDQQFGTDPLEQKVDEVSRQLARYQFFDANPEAKALEPKMVDFVLNLNDKGDTAAAQFYAQNWEHLYNAVKAQNAAPTDTGALIDQGRQDERANLARVQQAAAPAAAATSSAPAPQLDEDAQIAQMTPAEYNEWRKSHNPFAR